MKAYTKISLKMIISDKEYMQNPRKQFPEPALLNGRPKIR